MEGRLSPRERLLYASGSLGGNALSRARDLWLLAFYLGDLDDGDPARRGAAIAIGAAIVAVRLIEALDDPVIGYWSDRTRSRLGRRIPFVLSATPFLAIFFVLIWLPPDPGETWANVIYLFGMLWLFNLFSTLSGGPLEALLPEIARREDDRLAIVGWQVAFGLVGTAIGFVLSSLLIDWVGYGGMAMIIAVIAVVSRYVALAGAWKRSVAVSREIAAEPSGARVPMRAAILACLRNGQFLVFLPSFILYNAGILMIIGVLPFYADAVVGRDDTLTVAALAGSALVGVAIVLPFAVVLARRRSKRLVYGWGMIFAGLWFPLFALAGFIPGVHPLAQGIVYALIAGVAIAPVQTFPNALLADITDYDTALTGQRREATFYATHETLQKIAGAAAPGLLVLLLLAGSTADDPLGIRLVGPVAGALALAGYVVFRRYWLPDRVTAETLAAHAGRRG